MRANETAYSNSLFAAIRPITRHFRQLVVVSALAGAATALAVWLAPRRYEASMTLSTISNSRAPALSGGLGGLIAGASLGMTGPNPALITRIAGEYGVILRVSKTPVVEGRTETVADRLRQVKSSDIANRDLVRELRKMIGAGVDKASGVIIISAASKDSALARVVVQAVVRETSRTFIGITRAQGSELRSAMQSRLDSAARQLRSAEEAQRQFLAGNRSVSLYSPAAIEGNKLRQTVDLAQQIYTQALTDRESAVAKELEATPAVVVVDPVPAELAPAPRFMALKSIAAAMLAAVLFGLLVVARESVRRAALQGDPDAIEIGISARDTRFAGPLMGWLFPKDSGDGYDVGVTMVDRSTASSKRIAPRPSERALGE